MDKEKLVNDLTEYMYNRDPYEFNDCYDTREEALKDIDRVLSTKKSINLVLYELNEDMTFSEKYLNNNKDKGECEMFKEAKRLYDEILEYKRELKDEGLER